MIAGVSLGQDSAFASLAQRAQPPGPGPSSQQPGQPPPPGQPSPPPGTPQTTNNEGRPAPAAGSGLTQEQQNVVAQLAQIDRHVRAHEQAHMAAGAGYTRGAPSYSYSTDPDGKLYAVGGEVSIDTSPVPGDPEATIQKARIVQAAANAPADPSPQDREVAQAAVQMEINARLEEAAQRAAESQQANAEDSRLGAYRRASPSAPRLDLVG